MPPPPPAPYGDESFSPVSPSPLTTSSSASVPALTASQPASSNASFLQSSFIRDDYIQKQLALRVADFTDSVPLLLHLATWNVNAKRPDEDIAPWLLSPQQQRAYSQYDVETLDIDSSRLVEPDVYAIGFQEIVDLNAGNLLVDHNATRPWEDKIERLLKQRYVQVANKSLVGLALLVYVKRSLAEFVSDVVIERIGVGIMGVGGNKGAVAVRMNVYDSRLCFVNSHLAAHQHNTPGRNSDYASILQKCRFTDRRGQQSEILEHDNVFWIGDLNYRVDMNFTHSHSHGAVLHSLAHSRPLVHCCDGFRLMSMTSTCCIRRSRRRTGTTCTSTTSSSERRRPATHSTTSRRRPSASRPRTSTNPARTSTSGARTRRRGCRRGATASSGRARAWSVCSTTGLS